MTNKVLLKSENTFSYLVIIILTIVSLTIGFAKPEFVFLPIIITIVTFVHIASIANIIVYQDRIIIKTWIFHKKTIYRKDILHCIIHRVRGSGRQSNYDELTIITEKEQFRLCSFHYLNYEPLYRIIANQPICLPKDTNTTIVITCIVLLILSILPCGMIIMSLTNMQSSTKDKSLLLCFGVCLLVFFIYVGIKSIRWKDKIID